MSSNREQKQVNNEFFFSVDNLSLSGSTRKEMAGFGFAFAKAIELIEYKQYTRVFHRIRIKKLLCKRQPIYSFLPVGQRLTL